MPIHSFRPLTPAGRFTALNKTAGQLSRKRPERGLTQSKNKTGGRNVYGRVTSRHRGGGHKQLYRVVDFKRGRLDLPARVQALEYDPNRSANLALIAYTDGVKAYILAPKGLKVGDTIVTSNKATTNDYTVGNNFPLAIIRLRPACTASSSCRDAARRLPAAPGPALSWWRLRTVRRRSRCLRASCAT